ncbi:hypothetical protein DFQ14_102278 [Halopolyspora algeriensis]|uniref:Uncharacterized protein n=1 Tax=Halopolyspora algeriensis TaxID=1500506 RepID=A0A368VV57_9ACTN|nr:hypothetical protein [Halopolyspora algeriensis]RCW45976.1 hypothetical protein DFQ14_102278 [Halopolyspora algeriensis]TQM55389.1 hypothetical protein FHU43_0152 [Halopolyspora algeriensis]
MTGERDNNGVVGVGADLDSLFAEVEALRELASDSDKARDSARVYDFGIRWGALLSGRLQRLAHYHHRGELTPHEQARYEKLRTELRDVQPLAERLGIARPTIPLEDRR